jgi:hypothetical protein
MVYRLAISEVNVWGDSSSSINTDDINNCKQAKGGCRPAFVFSVPGQIAFRHSLSHLKECNKKCCQSLRKEVFVGMHAKLGWLMAEGRLLGCIQIQPVLYGASKVTLKKKDFSVVAHHLANCHQESCAQLRRSLMLTVRNQVGPQNIAQD